MFDTHVHLNFSRFKKNVDEVIGRAHAVGVTHLVIPATDYESSQKGCIIAEKHNTIYAAVGIHPHHVFQLQRRTSLPAGEAGATTPEKDWNSSARAALQEIESLISHPKVVAVGEIGIDRHEYEQTKHEQYNVTEEFVGVQKELFVEQIKLAVAHNKSLIIHNREATEDVLAVLQKHWDKKLEGRSVFHCCEPRTDLLDFAKQHKMFIGVDGDITYNKDKQEFIKHVPLSMLVLETDAPFLLPEPLKSNKEYPNEPKNIPLIAAYVSNLVHKSSVEIEKVTSYNGTVLFNIV